MLMIAVVDVGRRHLAGGAYRAVFLHRARLRTRGERRSVVRAGYRDLDLLRGRRSLIVGDTNSEQLVVAFTGAERLHIRGAVIKRVGPLSCGGIDGDRAVG